MGILIFFLSLFVIISFLVQKNKIKKLENRIKILENFSNPQNEKRLSPENSNQISEMSVKNTESIEKTNAIPIEKQQKYTSEIYSSTKSQEEKNTQIQPKEIKKKEETQLYKLWKILEKNFAENWTGILGSIILVLGITFFGVYTALKITEFFRFILLIIISVIIFAGYIFIRTRQKWESLANWLRSISGAILLFACVGSAGIPGFQWIDNQLYGLILLTTGILANIVLAYIGKNPVLASIHVLLSLAAIAVAPQNTLMFIIASIVTLCGVILTFREKWELNLLITISSFFAYHIFWVYSLKNDTTLLLTFSEEATGIAALTAICISAAFVHYRKIYANTIFEKIPFSVHLINWIYYAIGILLHNTHSRYKSIPIFIAMIAGFFLANYARKLKIRWLHVADTLISHLILLIGIYSLTNWGLSFQVIALLMLTVSIIFALVITHVDEIILFRFGICFIQIIFIAFMTTMGMETSLKNEQLFILAICASIVIFLFHILLYKAKENNLIKYDSILSLIKYKNKVFSISAFLSGISIMEAIYLSYDSILLYLILCSIILVYLIMRRIWPNISMTISAIITVSYLHTIIWNHIFFNIEMTSTDILLYTGPLFILSILISILSKIQDMKHFTWFGIYIIVANSIITSYLIFQPISPLISGLIWLILSLIFLELSRLLLSKGKDRIYFQNASSHLIISGYLFIGLFVIRHITVHLQSETYLGIVKARLLIELLAFAIIFYWITAKPKLDNVFKIVSQSWKFLTELLILFSVLTVTVEVGKYWHPIVWIIFSFALLLIGKFFLQNYSRLSLYSILFYWISIFQATFLLGTYQKLGNYWFETDWLLGSISIIIQLLYLIIFIKIEPFKDINLLKNFEKFKKFINNLIRFQNALLFYPLAICVAIFLYLTFSKQLLTLLWILEFFILYTTGILLKESHFRYISLGAIVLCIIRLIIFDLSQSTTLTKALVFIGVGIIMLTIHILYNHFKSRLEK